MLLSAAWATKSELTPRKIIEPSRLKEYPVGITNPTIRLGTPRRSITCMALGMAASLVVVARAMAAGSLTARAN